MSSWLGNSEWTANRVGFITGTMGLSLTHGDDIAIVCNNGARDGDTYQEVIAARGMEDDCPYDPSCREGSLIRSSLEARLQRVVTRLQALESDPVLLSGERCEPFVPQLIRSVRFIHENAAEELD